MGRIYLAVAFVSAVAGTFGYIWTLQNKIERLEAREIELNFAVESCDKRIQNILEDYKSDSKINSTPDSGLSDLVDPDWMLD